MVLVESILTLLFIAEKATPMEPCNRTERIGDQRGSVHPEPMDIPIDEVTLPGSQVMDAIGQLVSVLDHDRVARQPAEGTRCSLKHFCSHHSDSFDGRGDHICTENWLNDVEELLVTLGCTDE